jgi:hypothetical protein
MSDRVGGSHSTGFQHRNQAQTVLENEFDGKRIWTKSRAPMHNRKIERRKGIAPTMLGPVVICPPIVLA